MCVYIYIYISLFYKCYWAYYFVSIRVFCKLSYVTVLVLALLAEYAS